MARACRGMKRACVYEFLFSVSLDKKVLKKKEFSYHDPRLLHNIFCSEKHKLSDGAEISRWRCGKNSGDE